MLDQQNRKVVQDLRRDHRLREFLEQGSIGEGGLPRKDVLVLFGRLNLLTHDVDAFLVVSKRKLKVSLLKHRCDLEVRIVIIWVELNDLLEKFLSLQVVRFASRLPSFDLGQDPQSFVAVLKLLAVQHCHQVELSALVVAIIEQNFGHA